MKIEIEPVGPFDLMTAHRFLGGWTPAAYQGPRAEGHVHLAFVLDATRTAVGLCVRQPNGADSTVVVELTQTVPDGTIDQPVLSSQVARFFSLDIDGRGYPEIGKRDLVVGELQDRFPGLRPVCFYSPFEAGVWALISTRTRMDQAARIKARIAETLGKKVDVHGQALHAFPDPWTLAEVSDIKGLPVQKVDRVRRFAEAAVRGALDARRLRSVPTEDALAELEQLPGIGSVEFSPHPAEGCWRARSPGPRQTPGSGCHPLLVRRGERGYGSRCNHGSVEALPDLGRSPA